MSMLAQNSIRNTLFAAALLVQASIVTAESSADGEAIYRFYCYQCHGYAGDAATLARANLSPPPRDFTSATSDELPIERIVETVLNGREGTAMVSFASVLDEEDAHAVARYIRESFMGQDRAARVLANAYEKGGLDVEADSSKAAYWQSRAAELGAAKEQE